MKKSEIKKILSSNDAAYKAAREVIAYFRKVEAKEKKAAASKKSSRRKKG